MGHLLLQTLQMIPRQLVNTIRANQAFVIAYTLLLIVGLYPLLAWDKMQVFLVINEYHHPVLDGFFCYWTHLGSGITYTLLLVLLFFLKTPLRKLFIGLASFGVMSVIVQVLKRIVFSHHLRPMKVIQLADQAVQLHIVDNVDILTHLSFPSGHAGTIFTAACFLNFIMTRKQSWYSLGLLLIAVLVAYSRVYLCQHFYTDVYAGALIGGWTTLIVYSAFIDSPILGWLMERLTSVLAKLRK
jgi:membrane-associated phospholipid phosphatase